jgi:hypothetical protein
VLVIDHQKTYGETGGYPVEIAALVQGTVVVDGFTLFLAPLEQRLTPRIALIRVRRCFNQRGIASGASPNLSRECRRNRKDHQSPVTKVPHMNLLTTVAGSFHKRELPMPPYPFHGVFACLPESEERPAPLTHGKSYAFNARPSSTVIVAASLSHHEDPPRRVKDSPWRAADDEAISVCTRSVHSFTTKGLPDLTAFWQTNSTQRRGGAWNYAIVGRAVPPSYRALLNSC